MSISRHSIFATSPRREPVEIRSLTIEPNGGPHFIGGIPDQPQFVVTQYTVAGLFLRWRFDPRAIGGTGMMPTSTIQLNSFRAMLWKLD